MRRQVDRVRVVELGIRVGRLEFLEPAALGPFHRLVKHAGQANRLASGRHGAASHPRVVQQPTIDFERMAFEGRFRLGIVHREGPFFVGRADFGELSRAASVPVNCD